MRRWNEEFNQRLLPLCVLLLLPLLPHLGQVLLVLLVLLLPLVPLVPLVLHLGQPLRLGQVLLALPALSRNVLILIFEFVACRDAPEKILLTETSPNLINEIWLQEGASLV